MRSSRKRIGRECRGDAYVFQTRALVVLQETVFATEVTLAKTAVADDALGGLAALLVAAADLLHHGVLGAGRSAASVSVGGLVTTRAISGCFLRETSGGSRRGGESSGVDVWGRGLRERECRGERGGFGESRMW